MPVFVSQHGVDQDRRDVGQGHPQAVLVIGRQREAQQLAALGVDDA